MPNHGTGWGYISPLKLVTKEANKAYGPLTTFLHWAERKRDMEVERPIPWAQTPGHFGEGRVA